MLSKTIINVYILTMLTSTATFGTLQEKQSELLLCGMQTNDRELFTSLIKLRARVDVCDENRSTPLHWAASNGYADVAQLLIEKRASLTAQDKDGLTPLHKAITTGNNGLIAMLTTDASWDIIDDEGETALHNRTLKNIKKFR